MRKTAIALALVTSAFASPAFAAYTVTVYTGDVNVGTGFNAVQGSQALFQNGAGTASSASTNSSKATFTYNGALNFDNSASQNTGNTGDLNKTFFTTPANIVSFTKKFGTMGAADYSTVTNPFGSLNNFLDTSGSAANYKWGSLYIFQSSTGASAGQTLTITHDDGVSLYTGGSFDANGTYSGGTLLGSFTSGPTSVLTETYTFGSNVSNYTIVYGRENGTPSVLKASLSGAVPEPATWAMMLMGFGAVGYSMRRRPRVSYAI